MDAIAATARRAGQQLAQTSLAVRNGVLLAIKEALIIHAADVIAANARDMATAAASGLESAVAKRLILDVGKIEGLIVGLQQLIELPDPIGVASMHRQLADGLIMRRVSCPLGVLCIIFEARPEAVIQIASLALKSGNALILKGGKEAMHSNEALAKLVRDAIASVNGSSGSADIGVPLDAVQLVTSREDVAELLKQDTNIDVSACVR
jgi:glutamate-5-semialdehyde dehydrogenase